MSQSYPLHSIPARTDGGLGGYNRYFDNPLPALPYSATMKMYPGDMQHRWSLDPIQQEIQSRPSLWMPSLFTVPFKASRERFRYAPYTSPSSGSFYYNPQGTQDKFTVPENSEGVWGGSFFSKPFLRRGGVWGGSSAF